MTTEYGFFVTQTAVDNALAGKADASDIPDVSGFAIKADVDSALALKANTGDVNELLSAKADKADLPDFDTFAAKDDIPDVSGFLTAEDIADKADKSELPDTTGLASEDYVDSAVAGKLDASKVWNTSGNYFETTNSLANGSYAKLWNESSGGGAQAYTQSNDTLSFVGVNHWSDGDKVACQIYTKNKSTNLGVRMSFHPTLGAFYTKGVTGGNANNFASGREIAVKDDVDTLTSRIAELEVLVATLQDALENAVDASGNSVYTKPTV